MRTKGSPLEHLALSKASGGNTKENKAVDVVDDASEQRLIPAHA
jgi:hypothetical protein